MNESVVQVHDALVFQYYMPQISSSSRNFYTDTSWVAFDLIQPNEHAETEKTLLDDMNLPFVQEDDFNYYPQLSPRVHGPNTVLAEEVPVLGESFSDLDSDKKFHVVDHHARRLRRIFMKVLGKLKLKLW